LMRLLSWFGKEGVSIICMGVSSNLKVPSWGAWVVKGYGEIFGFSFVRILKRVDFPVFGKPTRRHCVSAFLIPGCFPFPDLFCFVILVFNFFRRFERFFLMFSADLCFGHSFIIISRQEIRSSSVVAR